MTKKAEAMKQKMQELKNEVQNLLDENKIQEAEDKTLEVKILNAQIEIQERLDSANSTIVDINNKMAEKEIEVTNLTSELESITNEKQDLMEKYNDAINKIAELNEKVTTMQPVVDAHNKAKYESDLNNAKEEYKDKFSKVNGLETFESEEIQSLIINTLSDNKEISNKAKYDLSEKIMEMFDAQNSIDISTIQEFTVENKNLNPIVDEFETTYGFKKQ